MATMVHMGRMYPPRSAGLSVVFVVALGCLGAIWPSISLAAEVPTFCREPLASEVRKEDGGLGQASRIAQTSRRRGALVFESNVTAVAPGKRVFARLLNFTTRTVGYGHAFSIERFDGTAWVSDPASPMGPWPQVRYGLPSGAASRCFRFLVPVGQLNGRYRFATQVYLDTGAGKGPVRRVAEFTVG